MSRSRPRPVLVVSLGMAALLLLAAGALWMAGLLGGSDFRTWASEPLPTGRALEIQRLPEAYRIVYRIEERSGGEPSVTTDKLWVERPFRSRLEAWRGPPPGSELVFWQVTDLGVFATRAGKAQSLSLETSPAVAAGDLRPSIALERALDQGTVTRQGRRRIAGRTCHVYRAGGPVSSGMLLPFQPDGREHADFCVDEAGIVLEELWVVEGEPLRWKVAREVEETREIDPNLVEVPPTTLPSDQGGGSFRPLSASSQLLDTFWILDDPPDRLAHEGRYAVIEPTPQREHEGDGPPLVPSTSRIAGIADIWIDGPDVLVLYQGGTLDQSSPFPSHPRGRRTDLGNLGIGQAIPDLRTNEIRVVLDGGRFVRLFGTWSLSTLDRLTQDLRAVEGTGDLTFLDEG